MDFMIEKIKDGYAFKDFPTMNQVISKINSSSVDECDRY